MLSEADQAAMSSGEISFVPVTASDLPQLRRWMDMPHWREWWGDPEVEIEQIRGMVEGRDTTRPYLFHLDGAPIGYIQFWFIADARYEPWITEAPWIMELPNEAVGLDLSIGSENALSKGLGSRALRQLAMQLWGDGHRQIVIDPDPKNGRAVRAYEKAGFRVMPEFESRTGDCLLMRFHPDNNEQCQ
ncbi:MAG: GNAT family N-acetyltransferase [Pseudomonadota bacterium]